MKISHGDRTKWDGWKCRRWKTKKENKNSFPILTTSQRLGTFSGMYDVGLFTPPNSNHSLQMCCIPNTGGERYGAFDLACPFHYELGYQPPRCATVLGKLYQKLGVLFEVTKHQDWQQQSTAQHRHMHAHTSTKSCQYRFFKRDYVWEHQRSQWSLIQMFFMITNQSKDANDRLHGTADMMSVTRHGVRRNKTTEKMAAQ